MKEEKIIQGTTPTFYVTLTDVEDAALFDRIEVIFRQCDKKYEKTTEEGGGLTIEGNVLECELTQEETLALKAGLSVAVQIRALKDGKAYATDIMPVKVYPLIENEVIEEETGGISDGE